MNRVLLIAFILVAGPSYGFIDNLSLHVELKDSHNQQLIYKDSKRLLFTDVDNVEGFVCSVYSPLDCKSHHTKGGGFKLNTEHTWPQSKGAKTFPAKGDLHHLYIANKESNSKRANHPFCIVSVPFWGRQGSLLGIDNNSQDCFEPRDDHKGNVARAMFYFSIRYKKELPLEKEIMFRSWHKLDPVDAFEENRNNKIEELQGNRNPFIDDQTLTEQIERFKF